MGTQEKKSIFFERENYWHPHNVRAKAVCCSNTYLFDSTRRASGGGQLPDFPNSCSSVRIDSVEILFFVDLLLLLRSVSLDSPHTRSPFSSAAELKRTRNTTTTTTTMTTASSASPPYSPRTHPTESPTLRARFTLLGRTQFYSGGGQNDVITLKLTLCREYYK